MLTRLLFGCLRKTGTGITSAPEIDYLIVTMASTTPSALSDLLTKLLPITLNAVASPDRAARAKPAPALTKRSPLLTTPMTLTGTRPVIAIGGWVASAPAPEFIK